MDEHDPSSLSDQAESDPLGGDETVLVVDDEPVVRRLVRGMLEREGYAVLEACDGAEALQLEESGTRIDLLLTDVVMPRIGGRALAERLQGRRPRLRVLFTSGHSAHALGDRGVLAQDSRVLEKPYTTQTLRRSVRAALDHAR